MNCDQLAENYDLYALGVLDEAESGELREHLARNCENCAPGVRLAAARVSLLSSLAPMADPPARLRGRVLSSIGMAPRSSWAWIQAWGAVAAAVLLVVFWFGHSGDDRVRELAFRDALDRARQSGAEAAQLKEVMEVLNAPETIVRVSSEGAAQPPQGKVFLNKDRGVLLLASNLPPAPAGKIYEMWVIPAGGAPVPAGLFQTDSNGAAVHLRKGPVDLAATGAVAVTLEAAGGAPQPTSQPIIVATLKKG